LDGSVRQQVRRNQLAALVAPLHERGPEMHVKDMENAALDVEVDAQTAALLATADAQVVVPHGDDREAAQHDVAVAVPAELPVFADAIRMPEVYREARRLVV